jgi:hypothetical protein
MTTDYKKLTLFEAAVIVLCVAGIGLILFQLFVAMPTSAKNDLATSIQVFDMSDAMQHAFKNQAKVYGLVVGGVESFYAGFYFALVETFTPIAQDINDARLAVSNLQVAVANLTDSLASNYQNNYVVSGVETDVGGKVMGTFIESFSQ